MILLIIQTHNLEKFNLQGNFAKLNSDFNET